MKLLPLLFLILAFAASSFSQDRGLEVEKYAAVKYEAEVAIVSETRWMISHRYDNQQFVVSVVNNPSAAGAGRHSDEPDPPLFPVMESSLIAVGEVTAASAFLSNDKGDVYTEFTIRLDDVLLNTDAAAKDRKQVTADREGGVVTYPNGQKVLYRSVDLPMVGTKYLFFFAKDAAGTPNFQILSSYDLSIRLTCQLETARCLQQKSTSTKADFIEAVRRKIADQRRAVR